MTYSDSYLLAKSRFRKKSGSTGNYFRTLRRRLDIVGCLKVPFWYFIYMDGKRVFLFHFLLDWNHCRGRRHSLTMQTDAASYWLYMAAGYVWKSWMLRVLIAELLDSSRGSSPSYLLMWEEPGHYWAMLLRYSGCSSTRWFRDLAFYCGI